MGIFDFIFKKKFVNGLEREKEDKTVNNISLSQCNVEKSTKSLKDKYFEIYKKSRMELDEYFSTGKINGKKISEKEINELIEQCKDSYENYLDILYDFSSVEGIKKIPIPDYDDIKGMTTPCYNIEYILNRKATKLKKVNIDLAIACLRKANEIYPYSNFSYGYNDYMRVVEFLKDAGRFDEARKEKEYIENTYLNDNKYGKLKEISDYSNKNSPYFGSDLIESNDTAFVCEKCAKCTKRIFSEYGKNPKYPRLPEYFKYHLKEHKYCQIHFFPVQDGISVPVWKYNGNLITFCNRPFVDERTDEEKKHFDDEVKRLRGKENTKEEFDWLREFLPELAPKSLSGYSRMKNIKSENYIKIKQAAKEKGKELIEF